MSRARPVVAIDGPAGAGKSTVTRRVAGELGYLLLGTGALYRTIALAARARGVAWDDAPAVSALAERVVGEGTLVVARGPAGEQRVRLADDDVTEALVGEEIGRGASQVSALPGVRAALLAVQRAAGHGGGVVAEGRDVGTVVFPDAEAKFFLTASVEVRSQRRWQELVALGIPADLDAIRAEVRLRDQRDMDRALAPLRQAEDAILVDSSAMTIEEVVDSIVGRVRAVERRLAGHA